MDELTTTAGQPETAPTSPYARIFFGLWLVTVLAIVGFRVEDPTHRQQPNQWRRQRIKSPKGANSRLHVAGLFPLKESLNKAVTDPGNNLTFPADRAPAQLDTFTLARLFED